MKKIVIVAPVHPWDDVRVFKKQAVSLVEFGYQVSLIAKADKEKYVDGVRIIPSYKTKKRLLRFLSIPKIFFTAWRLKGDVYHLHNPDMIPVAWLLKLLGHKVIYDTHEDFSQRILVRDWIPSIFRKLLAKAVYQAEKITSVICDYMIVTQVDQIKKYGKKAVLIGNSPHINEKMLKKVDVFGELIERGKDFRLIYIGGVTKNRGLLEMVQALEILNIERNISTRLWLIGPAAQDDYEEAKKYAGWQYVDSFPRMEQEKAFAYVSKSDLGLVYLRDVGDHYKSNANKTYEYMALGVPFIATNFPLWRKELEEVEAGIFIPPGSAYILADAVERFWNLPKLEREKMAENGQKFAKNNSWVEESYKLRSMYHSLFNSD